MTMRVLIVEDEIFVALGIEEIVAEAGLSVGAIAADRAAAIESAALCDIALVDLNLRDGPTGPEIGRILAKEFGIRVIYVTANPAQIGDAADAALGVITKPFRSETVKAVLAFARADNDAEQFEYQSIAGFTPFLPRPGSLRGSEYAE
ncbi:response regulator [Sphingobium sp. BS19]|uniref:response regulator n=1 Tax=Sphingobium sp. BS19 TaxID=3018973 RepID=UPI0024905464|nr:response regulator [Sphingobium sp. BS19]